MSEDQSRRASDVDPAVQLYVQQEVGDTRHKLTGQLGELGLKLDIFSAQSTKEHGEVAAKLDRLSSDVAELKPLAAKVAALELADATAETAASTAQRMREQSRAQFYTLAGLIVAVAGVIVGFGR